MPAQSSSHDYQLLPGTELQNVTNGKSDSTNAKEPNQSTQPKSYKLRRFFLRAVAVILGPVIVLAYYIYIWQLVQSRKGNPLKFGRTNELWIYYSWFVVGVFGLNFSKYGLLGIEASMLHDRNWQAKNAMKLLMHCDSSWSGPGGWLRCFSSWIWQKKNTVGRLWYTLAAISVFPFVALPLSGLTMEPVDGYVKLNEPPLVIGHTWKDFNRRPKERKHNVYWESGLSPTIPGAGILYTAPHVHRNSFSYLHDVPNTLPSNVSENNLEFFLAPQANVPISGNVWGLLIRYNCSIVKSFSEFKILTQRPAVNTTNKPDGWAINLKLNSAGDDIMSTMNRDGNLALYSEVGSNSSGVYSETGWAAPEVKPSIFEYALWQAHRDPGFSLQTEVNFSTTTDSPMAEVSNLYFQVENGTIYYNESFFGARLDENGTISSEPVYTPISVLHVAPPIGVRCIRDSKLGYADIDLQGSFHSFTERSPPRLDSHESGDTWGFGQIGITGKFPEILTSTNSPPPLRFVAGYAYPGFIQAETLYQSIMRAHGWHALELMYDSSTYTFESAYVLLNATSSRRNTVMGPGAIPPTPVGVLLIIWAVSCSVLGCAYGFRRRWSEKLDGYSMFRFGADFSREIRSEPDFACGSEFEECQALWKLPGLVGDSEPQSDIGHITLVKRGNEPDKGKRYR
ncbi:hypothetical protein AJ78_04474 [Emergomyces pasteurianus Ep9510]|uniref:Uncharacterized protein n=1 Tax=Emergomyces pasteurianus Ep9510 TaxID=1447872 RepID=A0A1J9QH59_9EURO|nr:hypothetical protein AJ78_04474 [Emergomyces pasteurianus Ep9510]